MPRHFAGLDAGGLTRELFTLMGRGMATAGTLDVPMRRLWKVAGSANRYQPEPCAADTHGVAEAVQLFRACGRFVGIAMLTGQLLDFSFARFFWQRVLNRAAGRPTELGVDANLADLRREGESELAGSMEAILKHKLADMLMEGDITLSRAASSSGQVLGHEKTVEFVIGGAEIEVTDQNKQLFVQHFLEHKWVQMGPGGHSASAAIPMATC